MSAGGLAVALVALIVVIVTGAGGSDAPSDASIRSSASTQVPPSTVGGNSPLAAAEATAAPNSNLAASGMGTDRVVVVPDPNFKEALERAPFSTEGWKTDFSPMFTRNAPFS